MRLLRVSLALHQVHFPHVKNENILYFAYSIFVSWCTADLRLFSLAKSTALNFRFMATGTLSQEVALPFSFSVPFFHWSQLLK